MQPSSFLPTLLLSPFLSLSLLAATLSSLSIREGYIPFEHPSIPANVSARTWYRIVDHTASKATRPLVVLHGGPGVSHVYLRPTFDLLAARTGRTVVYYDQFGGGNSTRYAESRLNETFWVPELFVHELTNVLHHLGFEKEYDLYGHSWGAMLAAKHTYLKQPKGLHKLILASGAAVMNDWGIGAHQLLARLPKDVQSAMLTNDALGKWDDPDYQAAYMVYNQHYLCRLPEWPPELVEVLSDPDDTVHATMVGNSELRILGNLRNFDMSEESKHIKVPTLVIHNEYDEAQPVVVGPWLKGISNVRQAGIKNGSHTAHLEYPREYIDVVASFLQ